ncbi:VWA domain-containing protein [uncultured Flavobacterium sp.]|uniref:nitric oxide reductase activation protein NorD n=1 Tax=uncultured Flavobacterium sp. TaxID=165435 RepID=UPI0025956A9C|nr:VWA domain-containing protein [uncultured Flavobacterium sp.]
MDLDELLFGTVSKYFKKRNKNKILLDSNAVFLKDVKPRLTILARAITGKAIELFPAEREGGYKNNNFFLPIYFNEFASKEANLGFYFFRILFLSVQSELKINLTIDEVLSEQNKEEILILLFQKYPNSKVIYQNLKSHFEAKTTPKSATDYSWIYGKLMQNDSKECTETILENFSDLVKKSNSEQITTTLQAKAVEEITTIEIDKKQQEDYVLLHSFEKVETAEEFNGNWRDFDGSDDLEKHENAIEDLNMKFTVRVDDTAHSVYQAEFTENTSISESAEIDSNGFHLTYDEWDFEKRKYKDHFCKVYPKIQLKTDSNYYQNTILKNNSTLLNLRKILTNLNNKMQQQKRQNQGEEFDIDAIIDLYVDAHSKKTPSDKIYLSNRKKEKDLSILLLLDISLSSDSYAAGNRVIDVEKQVSILFGEILNEFNIDFSIDSFYSKTRNFSTYLTVKDFDENWAVAKNKVGAIEPSGYTRIGAALRHAGARLDTRKTKNKWIILISDGKPNDYDKYEGKYGINDVKQALRELNQRDINSYALAIEAQAKYYLPQMFGQNHYQILTTPTELLQSMVKLYEKIKQN